MLVAREMAGLENKCASEEVCLLRRFPPETLHGGRVGVKEAEAGVGSGTFERRAEGRSKGWTL